MNIFDSTVYTNIADSFSAIITNIVDGISAIIESVKIVFELILLLLVAKFFSKGK